MASTFGSPTPVVVGGARCGAGARCKVVCPEDFGEFIEAPEGETISLTGMVAVHGDCWGETATRTLETGLD